MEIIVQILAFGLGCFVLGIIGMAIGDLGEKQNGKMGFLLGALLGPIGWIIVAIQPKASGKNVPSKERDPADPTKIIVAALLVCLLVLGALVAFGHFLTKY
jgi:hypothetical protein